MQKAHAFKLQATQKKSLMSFFARALRRNMEFVALCFIMFPHEPYTNSASVHEDIVRAEIPATNHAVFDSLWDYDGAVSNVLFLPASLIPLTLADVLGRDSHMNYESYDGMPSTITSPSISQSLLPIY